MGIVRQLSVECMARRVLRYVPELDYAFVCGYLRAYGDCGLSEANVHGWVRFFDRFVIDERSFVLDDGSSQW